MVRKGWVGVVPVVWAAAVLYAPAAHAIGLGRLSVSSNLGEPLRAEIPVLALRPGERGSVHARLASSGAFAEAGIRKSRALRSVICHIGRAKNGQYVVFLHSTHPIMAPFLHFLLRLKWSGGTLLHEYTALLNPANGVIAIGAGQAAPKALPAVGRIAAQHTQPAPRRPQPATMRVRPGETLWAVAERAAPDHRAMAQTLEAFFRANPRAFYRHNVNDLRAGARLQAPGRRAILAIPRRQAGAWLGAQATTWTHYQEALAGRPVTSTGHSHGLGGMLHAVRVVPTRRAALRIEPAALPGRARAEGSGHGTQMPGPLGARVAHLQQQLQKTQRLMTVEDRELALLEREVRARAQAHPAATGAIRTLAKPVVQGKAVPKARVPAVKGTAQAGTHVITRPLVAAHPAIAKPIAAPKPHPLAPVTAPSAQPSFFQTLLSTERLPILGALLAVLAGGFLIIRRRRQSMAEFEESILSGGGLNSEGQMADTAGLPKTPEASFLSEFSQAAGGLGAMHTDEVDPLAEADVYLAYGRDEQAEEILKEAAAKDTGRLELKLKLLEIYFQRHDVKTFEIVAEEIYAGSDGRGPLWHKVEEMGRKLDPENPLFRKSREKPAGMDREEERGAADDKPSAALADRIDFAGMARELEAVSLPGNAAGGDEGLLWTSGPAGDARPGEGDQAAHDAGAIDFPTHGEIGAEPAGETGTDAGGDAGLDFSLDFPSASEPATPNDSGQAQEPPGDHGLDFAWDAGTTAQAPEADAESSQVSFEDAGKTKDSADFEGLSFEAPAEPESDEDTRACDSEEFALRFDDADMADLSTLDLQLGAKATPTPEAANGSNALTEAETDGDAVETKLDLARAYLEMGDSEGARSILDEVRSEGNAQQRQVAESLVANLA